MASGDRNRGLLMLVCAVVAAAAWAGVLAVLKDHDIVRNPRVFKVPAPSSSCCRWSAPKQGRSVLAEGDVNCRGA